MRLMCCSSLAHSVRSRLLFSYSLELSHFLARSRGGVSGNRLPTHLSLDMQ